MLKEMNYLTVTPTGDCEISMTRAFDAPRYKVFAAMTRPHLLRRWLYGPDDWTLRSCEINLTAGGDYRYVWKHLADGREMALSGTYVTVQEPERVVATEAFDEPWYPDGEATTTLMLIDEGDHTVLTNTLRYRSRQARDLAFHSGMESGLSASYDRLDYLLEVL